MSDRITWGRASIAPAPFAVEVLGDTDDGELGLAPWPWPVRPRMRMLSSATMTLIPPPFGVRP